MTFTDSARTVSEADEVILLDDAGNHIGAADRIAVHTNATPLHLAFSTYLFNARGEVLVTRRALDKTTWPGVWTNSCCGHPRPGEPIEEAVRRRIREELGLTVGPITPLLPEFRYRAIDASGVVENEICPVFAAFVTDDEPTPNRDEVAEFAWVPWADFTTAISATPNVYSPWAALQVPQILDRHPDAAWSSPIVDVDPEHTVAAVDELLTKEIAALGREWEGYTEGLGVDVLPVDLTEWFGQLVVGRGKRLRVHLTHWGFIAAGGRQDTAAWSHAIRAAAALETLHLFALIHDDIMDESRSRRGLPSAHVQAAAWHEKFGGKGCPQQFGLSLAILLGDFAHTVADRMVDSLPQRMRQVWYELCLELMAGQRADLTGAAAGRRDRAHTKHVARVKSGRYTITRPLQLGAIAAGAPDAVVRGLMTFGDHVGKAFALRDDHLGIWGDPELTGKPVGDDLLDAKATVLLALAAKRLEGPAKDLLERVGTPGFGAEDVATLSQAMADAGISDEVERIIAGKIDEAHEALEGLPLTDVGIRGLHDAARAVAWRQH